jgi:N-acetylglucosamine kinase-like BadF-type ATPase
VTTLTVGIDAGNTKTIALAARGDGTIVGAARILGCADIYSAPTESEAVAVIVAAVDEALRRAGGTRPEIESVALSAAGADWPEDFELHRAALAERGIGRRVAVVNDAIGALRGAIPEGPAVVVVTGTGGATGARGRDGRLWHSSWWQEPQGAGELGRRALEAVYRAELGIDPPTALREAILAFLGMDDVEGVLHGFTARRGRRPAPTGSLARVLLDQAAGGDATAVAIVRSQARDLAAVAAAAARRVGLGADHFRLALTGGVLRHPSRLLADGIVDEVRRRAPGAERVAPLFEPGVGALLLAFDAIPDVDPAAILEKVSASLPTQDLYVSRSE